MAAAAVGVGGLALWRGYPARRCRALCVHRAAGAPSSQCIFHLHYVSPSVPTQNGRDGLAVGGGGGEPTLSISRSQSKTSVNDARPWKLYTPPDILVSGQCRCDVCMPFDTSDGPR